MGSRVGQQLRNHRRRFDGSFLAHVLRRSHRLYLDAGKSPRGVHHGFRLRRQQRVPPCIELPAADAVLARHLCRRCARRQALRRNRLLLLNRPATPPLATGKVGELLADNGYFSEGNVNACAAAGIEPMIAMGREAHHPTLTERFADDPTAPADPTPVEAMGHRLQTKAGKKLYALRKQTPEPVFGIIKSVLGFRQFMLRGLEKVRGEWKLVTIAWNLKRMFALADAN